MKCDMAGAAAVVAGDARDRRARAAGQGHDVRADGREHGLRLRDPARRRAHDVRRHDRRGRSTPTPRAGCSSATRWSLATEEKPDVILDVATLTGHMVARARRQGRRRDGHRRRSSTRVLAAAGDAPARQHWPMPIPEEMDERITQPARSPTCSSTTGSAGAAASSPRRSCASSPAACRGRTSTSPARSSTLGGPYGHVPARRHRLRRHHARRVRPVARRRGLTPAGRSDALRPSCARL